MERTIINPIFKDSISFIKTVDETGGAYAEHELTVMPGGRNPPHIHTSFTETFVSVQGLLGLRLKYRQVFLEPGEVYTVEQNELHNFFNPGKETIMFRVIHSPGHAGVEKMLRIMYGLGADGLTNKKGIPFDINIIALLSEMGDSRLPGINSILHPLFSRIASRARSRGLENELLAKYCR